MKKRILTLLSKKALSPDEVKRKVGEEVGPTMEEMEKEGLIFLNSNQQYAITLLGKILALGLKDIYESIVEKKDLFDFFRTRIPSAMPDKLLKSMPICNDFQMIGEPDLVKRDKEITDKALNMQLHVDKALYVSAPIMFKPGMLHMLGLLKKRTRVRVIVPESEYRKHTILYAVSKRVAQFKARAIREADQYMGLLRFDNKMGLFGFRNLKNKPGWDAVITTENKDCVAWVKENFEYMWDKFARKP